MYCLVLVFFSKLSDTIFVINKAIIKYKRGIYPFFPLLYCLLLTILPFLQSKRYKFGIL